MSVSRGRLITLEGIEGSGKSTLARVLEQRLLGEGHAVVRTREPGATPLGSRLRSALLDPALAGMDARAELLLYCADRAEHVARVIAPALAACQLVLSDRYSDATRAYQGFGRGLGLELVDRLDIGRVAPDLTLLLDLPPEQGLARAERRNQAEALEHEARFEREALAFHRRVRDGYLALAAAEPDRFVVLDARVEPGDLAEAALARLRARLAALGDSDHGAR